MTVATLAVTPALATDFGQLAEVLCIDPFEAVQAPDPSGLDQVDPAPQFVQSGDTVYAIGEAYLVLSGDFETEASRCEVYAQLSAEDAEAAQAWFRDWIDGEVDDSRYTATNLGAGIYESTDWREPRMQVTFLITDDIALLIVEDTDKEA